MHRKAMVWAVLCLLLFVGGFSVSAQEYKSGVPLFMVHEDFVKPSMVAEYEAAIKGFQAALRQHGVTEYYSINHGYAQVYRINVPAPFYGSE